ncbi:Gfo/Idh/MocA family protein [Actinokineospora guangxiensis]|uniref:Gfo/Idh/MocA family protein n=1 Tax=Actinokineospora guangxiensis TaxID=1490288 RepID=A0ABW0EUX8_9PSEU
MSRRRYAFVGTGHRAQMYFDSLLGAHNAVGVPVALCDTNPTRVEYYQRLFTAAGGSGPLPVYPAERYAAMLRETRPDAVVVTSVDATHADYAVHALDNGVGAIVEKPLTTDAEGCARISEAARRSSAPLVVTFNYRYSPRNSAVKRLLSEGAIGRVTAVHFEWVLDTVHGADYFRRWHREKANSGGLFVHKASHHFDLVNWWLDDTADVVTAHGGLRFYGDAEPPAERAPFGMDLAADPRLNALYGGAARDDGYHRDQDVFGPGVTIEDTMAALVRYRRGAVLTYSLVAYAPWEGYRVSITGTGGRLELEVVERSSVPAGDASELVRWKAVDPSAVDDGNADQVRASGTTLLVQRHWSAAEEVALPDAGPGHGGGDRLLLDDLFQPGARADPLGRAAGWLDGVRAVLVGAAANESMARGGEPVRVQLPGVEEAA